MKKLTLIIEDKAAKRIEAAAKRLGIKPEQLCLHSILEKLEEVSDYTSPVMLVDLRELKERVTLLEAQKVLEEVSDHTSPVMLVDLRELKERVTLLEAQRDHIKENHKED